MNELQEIYDYLDSFVVMFNLVKDIDHYTTTMWEEGRFTEVKFKMCGTSLLRLNSYKTDEGVTYSYQIHSVRMKEALQSIGIMTVYNHSCALSDLHEVTEVVMSAFNKSEW